MTLHRQQTSSADSEHWAKKSGPYWDFIKEVLNYSENTLKHFAYGFLNILYHVKFCILNVFFVPHFRFTINILKVYLQSQQPHAHPLLFGVLLKVGISWHYKR